MKRRVATALAAVAALALLVLAGACSEEEDLPQDTPTPQHTQGSTPAPTGTVTPVSTPTLQPSTSATPQATAPTAEASTIPTPTGEATQVPTSTPTTTEPPATTTPESAWEFPDIPAAPEGLSGEDSLADLMTYLDNFGSPVDSLGRVIETKDFALSEAARPPEFKRIGFAIEIRKPGGIWLPGDETEFERKRDDFLRWFAERRNLAGADCGHIVFSKPPSASMMYTGIDRAVTCPEGSGISTLLETLKSEIDSIIPATDLSGLDSFKELWEYVSASFPIVTEHYLVQPAGDVAEAPVFPIEVQMKKPGGWRQEDKDTYREWQDVTLQEIMAIRHLSGNDCTFFLFTTPDNPGDTMTFAGIDRRKPYCPPAVSG